MIRNLHFFPMARPVTIVGDGQCLYGIASFFVKDSNKCYVYLLGHESGCEIQEVFLNESMLLGENNLEDILAYNIECEYGYDTNKGLILKRRRVNDLRKFTEGEIELGTPVCGEAYLYTTIDGFKPDFFRCRIEQIFKSDDYGKQFEIFINDKVLYDTFGGGCYGMSGSIVLQKERLVGVLTNGYGDVSMYGLCLDSREILKVIRDVRNWDRKEDFARIRGR